jgi:hypothetical protein
MKNVFWDVTPRGSCKNRRFEERLIRVTRIVKVGTTLAVTNNKITLGTDVSWRILVTLVMEAIRFSETSVLTRSTRRNITEDKILDPTYSRSPYWSLSFWLSHPSCYMPSSSHRALQYGDSSLNNLNELHCLWSASQIYLLSGSHLSANLVPNFAGRRMSRVQRNGSELPLIWDF